MRSLTVPAFAFVLAACSSSASDAPAPLESAPDPDRVSHDADPAGSSASDPASSPKPITVNGSVKTYEGEALGHHAVTVLDSSGKRFDVQSDAAGQFSIPDVLPPYDLSTQQADGSNRLLMQLGVKSGDRLLRVYPGTLPSSTPAATAQIFFYVVPCPSTSCTYQIVTTSRTGQETRVGRRRTKASRAKLFRWTTTFPRPSRAPRTRASTCWSPRVTERRSGTRKTRWS